MGRLIETCEVVFKRYKEIILYLFFGGCTTLLNIVLFNILYQQMNIGTGVSTVISNLLCILFAYVTNRQWVFDNRAHGKKDVVKEMSSFFGCRIGTLLLDLAFMIVTVDWLRFNPDLMKLVSNIIVVIVNYVASKLLIFKKK